jgi:hypothetical protein
VTHLRGSASQVETLGAQERAVVDVATLRSTAMGTMGPPSSVWPLRRSEP